MKAADNAARALQLDEQGVDPAEIARELRIPLGRVLRLLDPGAPDHGLPESFRLLAPDGREGLITSEIPVSVAEVRRMDNLQPKRRGGAKPGAGKPPNPREHGTMRGYGQHRYRKEPVCRPCLDAYNAHHGHQARPITKAATS